MQQLWQAYKSTVFVLEQPLGCHFDFAIITACNPQGQDLPNSANRLRDKALQQDIAQTGAVYRSLYGCSPEFDYCERSWAVATDKQHATALAEKYQQNAIYWVEQGQLFLTPCLLTDFNEEHLGAFQNRLVKAKSSFHFSGRKKHVN